MGTTEDDVDDERQRRELDTDIDDLRHRIRYRFDNLLARGTWAVLLFLGVVTFAAILFSSLLLFVFSVSFDGSGGGSWLEDLWQSMLRVIDAGTMAGDVGWGRRILALAVTVFGLLVAGTLIGVIAAGVEDRIDTMRRGRSVVVERDHIVVLGGSERIPVLVDQLSAAYERSGGRTLVIMADRDPTDLLDEVNAVVGDRRGSRIVVRSGDPTRRVDLALVRPSAAHTIIVLSDDDDDDDVKAVKTVLAVGAELGGFDRLPIVVEISDPDTATTLVHACGAHVHPMLSIQAAARITAFAIRSKGMSRVLGRLLDFRHSGLFVRSEPDLVGRSFGDVVGRFANARPIGRLRSDGSVDLNPAAETTLEPGDRIVVIADDNGPLVPARGDAWAGTATRTELSGRPGSRESGERLLVAGWSAMGQQLVAEWVTFAGPGSTVDVMAPSGCRDDVAAALANVDHSVSPAATETTLTDRIEAVDGGPRPSTVVLLGDPSLPPESTDARVLLGLALVKRVVPADRRPQLVIELQDVDSVALAEMPGKDDYVVSDALGSRFIAQLAEQPERRAVLLSIAGGLGPSLRIEPAARLGLHGEYSSAEICEAAYDAGVIAVGWMAGGGDELVLNAANEHRVRLESDDSVIVIG